MAFEFSMEFVVYLVIVVVVGFVIGSLMGIFWGTITKKLKNRRIKKNAKKLLNGQLKNRTEIDGNIIDVDTFLVRDEKDVVKKISFRTLSNNSIKEVFPKHIEKNQDNLTDNIEVQLNSYKPKKKHKKIKKKHDAE